MSPAVESLADLYQDTQTCAKIIGLKYVDNNQSGLRRVKRGRNFSYLDARNQAIADSARQRIKDMVIPPAWKEVWICPSAKGHILATGIDERGRKQYIYHPKWRTMRDLIKFYRMIMFAQALPKIRKAIDSGLSKHSLSREKVIAAMLWILDNAYIRIGNEAYFHENESVGLTTLTDKNIIIAGKVVTLAFKGKSGKEQQITFEDQKLATIIDDLRQIKGDRLFKYQDNGEWHELDSADINNYLNELTGLHISAKDFRTWGGTLMAFMRLAEEHESGSSMRPEKAVIEAVDQAAAVLGNTRSVAKSSYIHPHILEAYGRKDFGKYYKKVAAAKSLPGLDQNESRLLQFLELLFDSEFKLLKK